jgi:hypothetical protein
VYIQKGWVGPPPLGDDDSHGCQHHDAEEGGVDEELYEVFEGCFGHDAANPGAEMIHFEHTTVNFAAMVGAVRFVGETGGAEGGAAVRVADEVVALPKWYLSGIFNMARRGGGRGESCVLCWGEETAAVVGATRFEVLGIG